MLDIGILAALVNDRDRGFISYAQCNELSTQVATIDDRIRANMNKEKKAKKGTKKRKKS